jgi:hypothetical protein
VVWVVMAVATEFIVVIIYLILGFSLSGLQPGEAGPIATRAWKAKNDPEQQSSSQQQSYYQPQPQYPAQSYHSHGYQPRS